MINFNKKANKMKKSLTIFIENLHFKEVRSLEKYGFKISGKLTTLNNGFIQTLTIKQRELYQSLKNLCILKEKVSLKMIKKVTSKISIRQLQIPINEKQTVCLNLFCETTEKDEKLEDIELFFDNSLLRLSYKGFSDINCDASSGISINDIIDIEIINN